MSRVSVMSEIRPKSWLDTHTILTTSSCLQQLMLWFFLRDCWSPSLQYLFKADHHNGVKLGPTTRLPYAELYVREHPHLVDALNNTIVMQRWSSMTGVGIPLPELCNSLELLLRLLPLLRSHEPCPATCTTCWGRCTGWTTPRPSPSRGGWEGGWWAGWWAGSGPSPR